MWNGNSIFWAVRLRDMHAHIHRVPIDLDCVAIRRLHSTKSPNGGTAIWDFDWPSSRHPTAMDWDRSHVNWMMRSTMTAQVVWVVVCHHLMLDVFALDHVWPNNNCYCLMRCRNLVLLCVIATTFRPSIDLICRMLWLFWGKNEKRNWKSISLVVVEISYLLFRSQHESIFLGRHQSSDQTKLIAIHCEETTRQQHQQ